MCKTPQNARWLYTKQNSSLTRCRYLITNSILFILFIALTGQKKKITKQEISWYFILASAIAGFVAGVFLVYGMQYFCRKKRNGNENEDEPEAAANPSYDGQVDPTSSAEAVYEEVDLKKLNKEENEYQNL